MTKDGFIMTRDGFTKTDTPSKPPTDTVIIHQMNQREKYLSSLLKLYQKLTKELIIFREMAMEAMELHSKGHAAGWQKLQEQSDKIEDKYDL